MKDIKIFTDNIDGKALSQCYEIMNTPAFENAKVRIMPDVHAGSGCVIGFTASNYDHIIPNIVGVDIGCGMLVVKLENIDLDLEKLDKIINENIASGKNVNAHIKAKYSKLDNLYTPIDKEYMLQSIGSLGGGNHFIEVDVDEDDNKYLIIHSGSRNLGTQVCKYFTNLCEKSKAKDESDKIIQKCIVENRKQDIEKELKKHKAEIKKANQKVPKELLHLAKEDEEKYLNDMRITQEFASLNRYVIAKEILRLMEINVKDDNFSETIHNYIDFEDHVIRKGSIKASKGKEVLIPLNMADGCILGVGKGNVDWNNSAPHGAGRMLSRSQAKESVKMEDFEKRMENVFSSSVCESTLDESPFAYKPSKEIIDLVSETVDIKKILKPIYNFKAH